MIINNKNYKEIWEDRQESYLDSICNSVITNLSEKEQILLKSYFWQGLTESEIAPLIGLTNQTSVSDYKNRVFAKVRMYFDREIVFVPKCIDYSFRLSQPSLYVLFNRLSVPHYINLFTEEKSLKFILRNFVLQIIEVLQKQEQICNKTCRYFKNCSKKCLQKHKENKKNFKQLYIHQNTNLNKLNLLILKKIFTFLLDWRTYDE